MKFSTTTTALLPLFLAATTSAAPITLDGNKMTVQITVDLNPDNVAINSIHGIDANDLFTFTSMHAVTAIPGEVVNGTEPTGGLDQASGTFHFGINSDSNMICYNITLHNFQGEFSSPAVTATHIHQAAKGASGPPRIAFPDPVLIGGEGSTVRRSEGCIHGPFTTGVMVDGKDSGEGFHVRQIEEDPAAFMADTHSSLALSGAVRGQLA